MEIHPASPGETNLYGILKFFIFEIIEYNENKIEQSNDKESRFYKTMSLSIYSNLISSVQVFLRETVVWRFPSSLQLY